MKLVKQCLFSPPLLFVWLTSVEAAFKMGNTARKSQYSNPIKSKLNPSSKPSVSAIVDSRILRRHVPYT